MSPLNKNPGLINKIFHIVNRRHRSDAALEEFQRRINYAFHNPEILKQALTHKSCVNPDDKKRLFSNERLEFLGDAILNCCVTENVYKRYPEYSEGQLSKIKSLLVSRKIIGEIALSMGIGNYLIMGHSERKTGGQKRLSIISNAFEAILGAIFLDGGIDQARKFLELFLFDRVEKFINDENNINYKSKILEMSQGDGFGTPSYPLLSEEGPDHAKKFKVGIDIGGVRLGEGIGSNKKEAQQNAAYNALLKYNRELILSHFKGD